MLILFMVGALTGTWLISGIVPMMIYLGMQMLSPAVFLPVSLIICALVSIATGSSWTTSATIGIALMGIGSALGINPGLVAGAIISGSYFGDKMSPLSDTTNLAAGVVGTPLFTHIRYMSYTTVPSILISLTLFFIIGLALDTPEQAARFEAIITALQQHFDLNPILLIAPIFVIVMVAKKIPALPAIFAGVVLGAIMALIFQPDLVKNIGVKNIGEKALADNDGFIIYAGLAQTMFGSTAVTTGNEILDNLLTSGGMAGMLNTVWLIICAMAFGGVMEASGMLRSITSTVVSKARTAASLITATAGTCILFNTTTSEQYMAVVLPGKMFPESYQRMGLAPENLSRTVEDSGTVTSVLVPWNACAAYHASVLGIATLSYAPYCFFNIISPFMTIMFAAMGIKIARLVSSKKEIPAIE